MSTASKRNLSGVVCLIGAVIMVLCIGRMIPYGLAGQAGKVKLYFVIMIVAFVFGLTAGLTYQYYRGKPDDDAERMQAEATILSQAGRKPDSPINKASVQSQPDNPTAPKLKRS